MVDLFSVHRDISFYNNKLEKNDCLYSKNLNWKFWGFLPQNLTYILRLFEANIASRVYY